MKLTRYSNNKPVNISANQIETITEGQETFGERDYPYSDVTDKNGQTFRVIESREFIEKLREEETIFNRRTEENEQNH